MAVWEFIKDLELDLGAMTKEEAEKLVSKLDKNEVDQIIKDLQEASKKNEALARTLNMTVSILEFAITKGLFV